MTSLTNGPVAVMCARLEYIIVTVGVEMSYRTRAWANSELILLLVLLFLLKLLHVPPCRFLVVDPTFFDQNHYWKLLLTRYSYIIDFEDAKIETKFKPRAWADLMHPDADPKLMLVMWGLWEPTAEERDKSRAENTEAEIHQMTRLRKLDQDAQSAFEIEKGDGLTYIFDALTAAAPLASAILKVDVMECARRISEMKTKTSKQCSVFPINAWHMLTNICGLPNHTR